MGGAAILPVKDAGKHAPDGFHEPKKFGADQCRFESSSMAANSAMGTIARTA